MSTEYKFQICRGLRYYNMVPQPRPQLEKEKAWRQGMQAFRDTTGKKGDGPSGHGQAGVLSFWSTTFQKLLLVSSPAGGRAED